MSYYDKKVPLEIIGDGASFNVILHDMSLPVYTLYYLLDDKQLYYLARRQDATHNQWKLVGEAPEQ